MIRRIPNISERIAWSMPFFERDGKNISFTACKSHVSLFVGVDAIEHFSDELADFTTKKSAIYFPYDRELPAELIEVIVRWCLD